jgi:hypothetical protein
MEPYSEMLPVMFSTALIVHNRFNTVAGTGTDNNTRTDVLYITGTGTLRPLLANK